MIELWVRELRRMPPGQRAVRPDGSFRYGTTDSRYVWPAELDLMAQLAGLELESRVADWSRAPYTSDSTSQVSVWRKPLA